MWERTNERLRSEKFENLIGNLIIACVCVFYGASLKEKGLFLMMFSCRRRNAKLFSWEWKHFLYPFLTSYPPSSSYHLRESDAIQFKQSVYNVMRWTRKEIKFSTSPSCICNIDIKFCSYKYIHTGILG